MTTLGRKLVEHSTSPAIILVRIAVGVVFASDGIQKSFVDG
jgi:hypothetical protein